MLPCRYILISTSAPLIFDPTAMQSEWIPQPTNAQRRDRPRRPMHLHVLFQAPACQTPRPSAPTMYVVRREGNRIPSVRPSRPGTHALPATPTAGAPPATVSVPRAAKFLTEEKRQKSSARCVATQHLLLKLISKGKRPSPSKRKGGQQRTIGKLPLSLSLSPHVSLISRTHTSDKRLETRRQESLTRTPLPCP